MKHPEVPGTTEQRWGLEESIRQALAHFGWTADDDFWHRYYRDPWVYNLANAVVKLVDKEQTYLAHRTKVSRYPAREPHQPDGWVIECGICDYSPGTFSLFEDADRYARLHEDSEVQHWLGGEPVEDPDA